MDIGDTVLLPLVVTVSATVVVSDPVSATVVVSDTVSTAVVVSDPLPVRSKGTTPLPSVAPVIAIPESVIIIMNIHKFTSNIKHHLRKIILSFISFHRIKAIPCEEVIVSYSTPNEQCFSYIIATTSYI
jgi:hypothetical protein